ncbi:hypothetical protein V6N12_049934 [Hibiscus sabdariffa]|uniref:DUF4283 domain-containing protein n=1 Tax=Hibiscus sabdariffa TaxID=183260 RepID=A0ABR2GBH8_9ROSI
MFSTSLNVVRTAVNPPDPLDPGRLFDRPDPPDLGHAPLLPSDDISSAMDTSGPVDTDPVHVVATSPLAPTVVPPVSLSTPSYKDKLLMSGSFGSQPTAADFVDDEEVLLLEGDVSRSNVNGMIYIQFSERVQALAVKNLEMTVVIKLLGRRIGYHTLRTKLYDLWKPSQAFRLMDIENDYFLVTFRAISDYNTTDICPSSIRATSSPSPIAPMVPVAPSVFEAFGPWMLVECRQRRSSHKATSHIVASPSATVDVPAVGSSAANAPSTSVVALPTSKSFVSQTHGKEKSKVFAKQGDPSKHLRKPVTIQRSAAASTSKPTTLTNRRSFSLSSTRFAHFPRPSSQFNKANHTVVVVDENVNLNVHSPAPVFVQADPLVPCDMVTMSKDSGEYLPSGILRDKKAKQRKVRNRITSLQLPDGSWCDAESVLRSEATKFFRGLFLDNDSNCRASYPFSVCFPTVPQHVLDSLANAPSFSEANGNWNTSRLSALLDLVAVPYVIGVLPPSLDDARDMVAGGARPSGFSLLPRHMRVY